MTIGHILLHAVLDINNNRSSSSGISLLGGPDPIHHGNRNVTVNNQSSNDSLLYPLDTELHQLTTAEKVMWIILYSVVAFLAVSGNSLVVYVIFTSRKLRNVVTNYFIVNLAIADALTGLLAVPFKFQAALLQYWPLPSFMCSLVPFIETVTLSVSVLTLTGTAVDRFQTVVLESKHKLTPTGAKVIVLLTWLVSVVFSAPYGYDHQTQFANESNMTNVLICVPVHGDELWWKVYNIDLTIVQYFVPLFIINGVYIVVAYRVWLTEPLLCGDPVADARGRSFQRNKKRVLKMLVIVVAVFTFCWLPYEMYLVLNEIRPNINNYYYINVVFFCCHWLAMSNSCLNPIIYGIYNVKIFFSRKFGIKIKYKNFRKFFEEIHQKFKKNEKFQREYRRVICGLCDERRRRQRRRSRQMKQRRPAVSVGRASSNGEDFPPMSTTTFNGASSSTTSQKDGATVGINGGARLGSKRRRKSRYGATGGVLSENMALMVDVVVSSCHQYIVSELGKDVTDDEDLDDEDEEEGAEEDCTL